MTIRGAGDRWLAGEAIEGIAFAHNESVEILSGQHKGQLGIVIMLLNLDPDPTYLVAFGSSGDARVRQSQLRAAP